MALRSREPRFNMEDALRFRLRQRLMRQRLLEPRPPLPTRRGNAAETAAAAAEAAEAVAEVVTTAAEEVAEAVRYARRYLSIFG